MRATSTRGSLLDRLWRKVDRRGPDECWLWTAGSSRSGRREVNYGEIREGGLGSRMLRANRLVLLLKTAPTDVPRDADESLVDWLRRANRWYAHLDAAHMCDVSLCCNPEHLKWKTHADNISDQRLRERANALVSTAPSSTSTAIDSAAPPPAG